MAAAALAERLGAQGELDWQRRTCSPLALGARARAAAELGVHPTTVSEAARVRAEDPELAARVMRGEVSLHRAIRELHRRANGDLVMARQRPRGVEEALRREQAAATIAPPRYPRLDGGGSAWMDVRAERQLDQLISVHGDEVPSIRRRFRSRPDASACRPKP